MSRRITNRWVRGIVFAAALAVLGGLAWQAHTLFSEIGVAIELHKDD